MSITQALNTALSGLHATQAGISLVAANVANSQTPGYVRKSLELVAGTSGLDGSSVRVTAVNRELDQYLQRQVRVETSGGAYADLRAQFYQRLQTIYGDPNSSTSLESLFNSFTGSLQGLVASPDSTAAQSLVLSSAQVLAQTLNTTSSNIQGLRADAESAIADSVNAANDAMKKISDLNISLAGAKVKNAADAALADQRDYYIDQLTQLMDIRVVTNSDNQVSIFTNSGIQLVGSSAAKLAFNPQGTVSATTNWDADPAKSNLGTLSLVSANGSSVDLIATNSIRSGKIAALIDMRDNVLVEAQNQIDSLALSMAQSLSTQTVDGTAVTSGAQSGFDVDTAGLLNGNVVNLTYTDSLTNTQHRVSLVRVDDPSLLPLDNGTTPDLGDEVIGVDFSGGLASAISQLNAQFGGALQFSNPTGSVLEVLDDGGSNLTDVNALSVTQTATGLSTGSLSIPLFTDGTMPFTGAMTSAGPQGLGFAGRITVNPAMLGNPRSLTLYDSNISTGDPTRPNFILNQLTDTPFAFSSNTGLGNASTPFTGSVPDYLRQVLSMQGENAQNAANLAQGQDVVVQALQQRVSEAAGVNVDQEMANLISLQTAYGANARVMSTVRELLDILLKI